MTDWLEAIVARPVLTGSIDGRETAWIEMTVAERDRLVALARGVERLAEAWESQWEEHEYGAELRRLLDGRDG